MVANDDQPRSTSASAAAATRRGEADRLFLEAVHLREGGRTEEAVALLRRAARLGDLSAQVELGSILTDMGDLHRPEGRRRLRRAVQAGNSMAAWNLAMDYRMAGDRRRYLHWLRAAARLGYEDAIPILAEIDRRIVSGRPWTMIWMLETDACDVAFMLEAYRDGRVAAQELAVWADATASLRATLALEPPRRVELAVILRELADLARPITRQRASELLFRLGY